MSSFTLAGLGPLKGQASIDLHEMMSVDAYPSLRSARVQVTNDRRRGKRYEGRPLSRPRPFRPIQSTRGGRRRGRPTRTRDHLVDEKPQPAVRLLGEYEHPKVVALGLAAAGAHVAYPLQDVVLALEVDLAAC